LLKKAVELGIEKAKIDHPEIKMKGDRVYDSGEYSRQRHYEPGNISLRF